MRIKYFIQKFLVLALLVNLHQWVSAADESYIQTLTGKIKKGDSCVVIDDKFLNLPLNTWNLIQHLTVNNIVSFELRFDTSIYYHNKPFTCTLNVSIKYFTSRDQETPEEINNIDLVVRYDTAKGKAYPVVAQHKFKNAFKVIVVVNSIKSAELGTDIPAIFRLKNQILVKRRYPFNRNAGGSIQAFHMNNFKVVPAFLFAGMAAFITGIKDDQIYISWTTAEFNGPQDPSVPVEYDIEWTFIDELSKEGDDIATLYNDGASVPYNKAEEWMRNNSTRVTVGGPPYTINLPYPKGYVLIRIRAVGYTAEDVRELGAWRYEDDAHPGFALCRPTDDFQPNLNWQYTAAFAEEGKRKEVISYFDATLRSRQSVTVNNSDLTLIPGSQTERQKTAIIQETIYDDMGRPVLNVLPAPTDNKLIRYYPAFNKNSNGDAYSHHDIQLGITTGNICHIGADAMSTASGASRYYSPQNPFMGDNESYYFTKYVPDAEQYPYSLTEYTPDGSGRVRRQGGVGKAFQPGSDYEPGPDHVTQYFYSKPSQKELDRLFGSEAGNASHYLKNMVVDPNGQISVSYVDAGGRTVATALAGKSLNNLETLPGASEGEAKKHINQRLIGSPDFRREAGQLMMQASATFTAAVSGNYKVHYDIHPAALTTYKEPEHTVQFCNNCYYDILVEVRDDCGVLIAPPATSTPFSGNDVTCHTEPPVVTATLNVDILRVGEYTVTYTLRLSDDVIQFHEDYYIENNVDLLKLQDFFISELEKLDLLACYNDCESCKTLGTETQFREKIVELVQSNPDFAGVQIPADPNAVDPVNAWIHDTWTELNTNCSQLSCDAIGACEDYLLQMKQDVLPGGQYAPYTYDEGTDQYTYTERTINVLQYYQDVAFPDVNFNDDNGVSVSRKSLSESDLIREYIKHPEWADDFVTKHIEYCSYLWCKDASYSPLSKNNEASYNFDKTLRENIVTGADAVNKGYYNRSDIDAILSYDPFFTLGGRGFSMVSQMQQDLNNLSTVLGIVMKDENTGDPLPAKNIFQLIDWILYCKSSDPAATGSQLVASWTSCAVTASCRSVTLEWELYRNYYLKLKNRYMQIVKAQENPTCTNCFVGQDVMNANTCEPPGPLTDYNVIMVGPAGQNDPPPTYSLQYNNGTEPFKGDYLVNIRVYWPTCDLLNPAQEDFETRTRKGQLQVDQILTCRCGADVGSCPGTTFEILSVTCLNGQPPQEPCDLNLPCPDPEEFDYELGETETIFFECGSNSTTPIYYVHDGGPVSAPVKISVTKRIRDFDGTLTFETVTKILQPGQDRLFLGNELNVWDDGVECNGIHEVGEVYTLDYTALVTGCVPPSTCTSDPNYLLYGSKIRRFNDQVDERTYLNCQLNNPPALPTPQEILESERAQAMQELETLKEMWREQLKNVRNEETAFSTINDNLIDDLVDALYEVSEKYIQEIATAGNVRPVSTLPGTETSSWGHNSFEEAFIDLIGSTLVQQGFSHDLLADPYPYDKAPILVNPNSGEINTAVCNNLSAFITRFNSSGAPDLHTYLKEELGEDFMLTPSELDDLVARCTNGCKYTEYPVLLPAAFAAPVPANTDHPFVDCNRITTLQLAFNTEYPGLTEESKLYRVLYTNYLNHQLGYALPYYAYVEFETECTSNATAVLYNKPASPAILPDDFMCAANQIRWAYERAGQEYERYIIIERKKFRNTYIATCLANTSSANLEGDVFEYHYTLYYYDQSGNLVKTIPPEGVRLLSDEEVELVDKYRGFDPASCLDAGIPTTEDKAVTFSTLSSNLQTGAGKSLELWLNSTGSSPDRHVRIITPDNKYMLQAAIHDDKLWVELYSLTPGASGEIDITLTNHAVADISSITLQPWTHLVIQSADFAADPWELYLDGRLLTLIPPPDEPGYPFAWEIDGGFTLPAEEVALLKHLRLYNNVISPSQVLANYNNFCLAPEGQLKIVGNPLLLWGRFNIPTLCNTAGTVTVPNRGSLQVNENRDFRTKTFDNITNDFAVELWVNPQETHEIDVQSATGSGGTSGQKWAIYPTHGGATGKAYMGISVGTNGVSVYEHADGYMPPLLVWSGNMTGWKHVAVVYTNKTPSLYVDGAHVANGLTSTKQVVSPSYNFGGGAFGFMPGGLDEARIWSVARTGQEIAANWQQGIPSSTAGLAGYWPMSPADGMQLEDYSCNNNLFTLNAGQEWQNTGAPINDQVQVEYVERFLVPQHGLPTNYVYNSLNQVIKQTTPDAGISQFYYDRLGRLTASQNAEQLVSSVEDENNRFSYSKYDELGRVFEVGEKTGGSFMSEGVARDQDLLEAWQASGTNRQVTEAIYDESPSFAPEILTNLRKRIAATVVRETAGGPVEQATYYSYDISGNVKTLFQEIRKLVQIDPTTGIKKIDYEYDLISGKVNLIKYQEGKGDQFYYDYLYDADNRVIAARTSRDALTWNTEATYRYYLHGPLARMQLGEYNVQGIDYAYTLQGWLKGINSIRLDPEKDMSQDGKIGSANFPDVGRDVMAFSLGYYSADYLPIGGVGAPAFGLPFTVPEISYPVGGGDPEYSSETGNPLFNGNISHTTLALNKLDNGAVKGYTYRYDQLNRLKQMRMHNIGAVAGSWSNTNIIQDYQEDISYDANGNILGYVRNGNSTTGFPMDNLSYHYNFDGSGRLMNNKLRHVLDNVITESYVEDLASQEEDNYTYDKIGNLISDQKELLTEIRWTAYGKLARLYKDERSPGPFGVPFGRETTINYKYDASGNRVTKSIEIEETSGNPPPRITTTTFYVRDAQGNVLAAYRHESIEGVFGGGTGLTWAEQYLYGSSRLGIWKPEIVVAENWQYPGGGQLFVIGQREYEITNHLSNVLTTISDDKLAIDENNDQVVDYNEAVVLSARDYYPFGMIMPGRKWGIGYRYGFNGKENDNEVKGEGNQQDYGFRIYDPRIGKFLSVDPLTQSYPWYTPYQFAANSPILSVDIDGLESDKTLNKTELKLNITPPSGDCNSCVQPYTSQKYSGPIQPVDVAVYTGQMVYGSSRASESFTVGGYTLLPNYVTGTDGKEVLSHYTASVMIRDLSMPNGRIEVPRIDWVIPEAELGEFAKNVEGYGLAANFLFGAGSHMSESTINFYLGNWGKGYLNAVKEQLSNPMTYLAFAKYSFALSNTTRATARNTVATTLKRQKQMQQHTIGGKLSVGKGTLASFDDAQKVLNALHNGEGTILKISTSQNTVFFWYRNVTGTHVNLGAASGAVSQPTNLFMIKGRTEGATVVPVNPNKILY